ncbi:MAG TPA: glycine cleavage system aminomethyltransferase GcvT [Candidatus Hydrogenedentes bacterium]|nr:glycine cleavage system aminomethyltransferase GcvT [Candidatus Hydrogenedentota bacterium]HOS03871.1 glycine cleavage system aminomethyltransferase GcvT [Candidatus Hydrogenedentota bacterium]
MRRTPLYDEHVANGAKVVDFHGWLLPIQYAGILEEHAHTRSRVSLFDCSHMGEFILKGHGSIRAFDRLVCMDAAGLPVGRCRYGALLNEAGRIVDDVIALRLDEDLLYVVTNAGALDAVRARILEHAPDARDVSESTAKIDVQGPGACEALMAAGISAARDLRYFAVCRTTWKGAEVIVTRAGYTGERGYELYLPPELAPKAWRALIAVPGTAPAGLGARDTLRTEMGYPLSGQDVDESRTPLEARMDRFIAWNKEFVGREALVELKRRGGYPVLTAIRTRDRRAPRHGFEAYADGVAVGTVTSGVFGPSVGYGIGLAYLPDALPPESILTAGPRSIEIEVSELPFYRQGSCRD